MRARGVLGQDDARADGARAPRSQRRQSVVAVTAAGDVQPRRILARVAAAVAPGERAGRLRVVLDQVLEDGDADLLDAGGLDDLNGISEFLFFWRFGKRWKKNK